MGANNHNPKAVQIKAINDAIKEMGMLTRIGVSEVVEQLLDALVDDELPERTLMVDYRGHNESWLLATNQRLILMYPKLFSKKRNVQSFPYDQLTDVEWDPGKAKHRITIHAGRKKEVCHGWWMDGQGKGRDMVEHVRAKIPQGAAPVSSSPQDTKARAVEDFVSHMDEVSKAGIRNADIKQLADTLEADEMPERMTHVAYDPRAAYGYRLRLEAMADLQPGLLAGTNRRLIFVRKPTLGKAQVVSIAYDTIADVTFTDGNFLGSVSVWVEGLEQKFDKIDRGKVPGWVRYLQQQAGITSGQTSPETAGAMNEDQAKIHVVEGFLRRMEKPRREMLQGYADPRKLANLLEPGEAVQQMNITAYSDKYFLEVDRLIGVFLCTDQRVLFFSDFKGGTPYVASFTYSVIDRIHHTRGRSSGSISIWMDGVEAKFDLLPDGDIEEWVQYLKEQAGIDE